MRGSSAAIDKPPLELCQARKDPDAFSQRKYYLYYSPPALVRQAAATGSVRPC